MLPLIQQSIMGNLCIGDAQQTVIGIQDDNQAVDNGQEEDDMIYETFSKPRPEVAYDINDLPPNERDEKKLAQLQQKIRNMQANERKGKKTLKINRKYPPGQYSSDPFYLRFMDCIYVGEWVYSNVFNSSIPGGLGRIYKEDQIIQGQFRSFYNSVEAIHASQNLSQTLIKENSKRAKFFNVDIKRIAAQSTDKHQEIRALLDGYGRVFSRTKELEGNFKEGILHGKGSMLLKEEKDEYRYQGGFNEGKKEGKGMQKYRGNTYQGDFKDDMKSGRGILTLFISHKFQEQQKKEAVTIEKDNKQRDISKLNQKVQQFIEYRQKYFDQPLNDAISQLKWKPPQGKLKNKRFIDDSDFMLQHFRRNKFNQYYKGQFKDNLFEGQGKYVWFNGKTYDGTWKAGKMHGYGQFFWHTGGYYYQGQYQNDLKHGKGTIYWGLTKRYRGTWAYGLRHGYGQLISIQSNNPKAKTEADIKALKDNETSKITVIGALFDKDEIQTQYFKKEISVKIQTQVLSIKFQIANSKVIGVRCDLVDPLTSAKEDQAAALANVK